MLFFGNCAGWALSIFLIFYVSIQVKGKPSVVTKDVFPVGNLAMALFLAHLKNSL